MATQSAGENEADPWVTREDASSAWLMFIELNAHDLGREGLEAMLAGVTGPSVYAQLLDDLGDPFRPMEEAA
jgi:hypothetical protein